jgi:hypothetical protein
VTAAARVARIAAELRKRGVPVSDMEMLDAFLDLIGDDDEPQAEFIDGLTGDTDLRAGELAEAMIARAGRQGDHLPRFQRRRRRHVAHEGGA